MSALEKVHSRMMEVLKGKTPETSDPPRVKALADIYKEFIQKMVDGKGAVQNTYLNFFLPEMQRYLDSVVEEHRYSPGLNSTAYKKNRYATGGLVVVLHRAVHVTIHALAVMVLNQGE